jgi:hypothetical protein
LNLRRDPSVQDLHHSDIITYALTRLASQYARDKQEIIRDLRGFQGSLHSPASRTLGPAPGAALTSLAAGASSHHHDHDEIIGE